MSTKKLKRSADGKFASKAVKEVKKAAPAAGNVPTDTPKCEPALTCGCPPTEAKQNLIVGTSFESSTSAAIAAAKDLIAFYAALGFAAKSYYQSAEYSAFCGTRYSFQIRFEK